MRIVGGEFRGRSLLTPKSGAIRPTADRIKENVFNVLAHNHPEFLDRSRVLDLFAGTGALGIEALSRGADYCLFIENSNEANQLLRKNIEKIGLDDCTSISKNDATRLGRSFSQQPFNLVFADPPYNKGFGEKAVAGLVAGNWLAAGALLVLEESQNSAPSSLPGFENLEQRTYGGTTIGFYQRKGPDQLK